MIKLLTFSYLLPTWSLMELHILTVGLLRIIARWLGRVGLFLESAAVYEAVIRLMDKSPFR
ncbi:hypothetical protein [Bradyrhizobium aeschynomenes]|uniref:hypothetical protein n=1 Tax=Bradyrhizobium aeschynomenes TaxID=2734909 RepID=UPI0015537BB5|nr:hypothetical protein [Bradyrhizobium aeschynomenes]